MKPIEPIKSHEMKIMVQPISLQNQKHITESEALPQCPENAKTLQNQKHEYFPRY